MDQLRSFRFSSSLKTKLFCSVRQNPKSRLKSGLVLLGNKLIFFFKVDMNYVRTGIAKYTCMNFEILIDICAH